MTTIRVYYQLDEKKVYKVVHVVLRGIIKHVKNELYLHERFGKIIPFKWYLLEMQHSNKSCFVILYTT